MKKTTENAACLLTAELPSTPALVGRAAERPALHCPQARSCLDCLGARARAACLPIHVHALAVSPAVVSSMQPRCLDATDVRVIAHCASNANAWH